MNLDAIAAILERRIGLDPASLGASALAAAVAERMRTVELTDVARYAAQLDARPEEFAVLADRLVVSETWFFRGGGLFDELAGLVASTPPAGRPFRALSLPCSTGEEPFSLAIALLEAGVPESRWTIDGIDLSPRNIEAAHRGVFRELSFRQTEAGLRDRYFRPSADGWQLDARVLGCVRFSVGNVFDPPATDAYDLILCRNLLIYLTAAARRRTLDALETMLASGGLLAVGHAEPRAIAGRGFRSVGPESHFVFCREFPRAESPASVRPAVRARVTTTAVPAPMPPPPVPPTPLLAPEEPMAHARRLADAGLLDEALEACRSHLKLAAPTALAYNLLGAIHQARGDAAAAADAFRKSLYLDPNDRDALTHALLLAARTGDVARAAALRERLGRIGSGGEA
jgi:chemotaxis protein methyltransferase WspC